VQLRPYQQHAVEAIEAEFARGIKSTLLVMATGLGKTVVLAETAKRSIRRTGKPVLVIAHRMELLDQLIETFEKFGMRARLEKAESKAAGKRCDVVIASVQTLSKLKRLQKFKPDHFGLIETDEAHRAVAATYRTIYDYFDANHLGCTATPNRHDEIGLRNIYETVAFQYAIAEAIRDGWLCPIRAEQVQVEGIHLEDVKIVAGDFSQTELDEMLLQESTLQSMVIPTLERAGDRPTIIFTPSVAHAHEIASCINRLKPGAALAVDGGMDPFRRSEVIDRFKSGKIQFLCNVMIATEGFDHPPTSCIAFFRPTKSLGLFTQCVGRATRQSPGKEDALILDFVGVRNTVRTITVVDVLDGTILKDEEHKKALELQEMGYAPTEALAEAKQYVANLDSVKVKMKALSTANAFDVLALLAIPNSKGMYGGDLATDKQVALLQGKGIKCPPDLEKGEAVRLIDQLFKRQEEGLATFKQIKFLRKLGVTDPGIDAYTFNFAKQEIDRLVRSKGMYYPAKAGGGR
jgi:superfamily II DNA or RNA helicase